MFENKPHVIPAETQIHFNTIALHRNPKYWVPPGKTEAEAEIDAFRPQRWFVDKKHSDDADYGDDAEEGFAPQGKDTSKSFYRPYRGSYIPFSDGSRACLGRKFANVEFVVALAVLLRRHSIELAVKEGETYQQAKRRAWEYVNDSGSVLTLKPKGKEVGVVCVPVGQEKYFPQRG